MVIARERYLDDTSRFRVSLELASRTDVMHSVLSELPAEVHASLGDALVRALDEIAAALAPSVTGVAGPRETSSFGCGT